MDEERTRDLSDNRSFEERVFARFDAIDARFDATDIRVDARFDTVNARLDSLDVRVQNLESRALDTKPIWERALAEILEVKEGVEDVRRKFKLLTEGRFERINYASRGEWTPSKLGSSKTAQRLPAISSLTVCFVQ
jgi:hypothetical protein